MSKLLKRLKKIGIVSVLISLLTVQTAMAAYTEKSGTLQPATYLFSLALTANGIAMTRPVDTWFSAYELYLNKGGDSGAVSRLNALKNMEWGESYAKMDQLYADVHAWLDACSYFRNNYYLSPIREPQPLKMSEIPKILYSDSVQTTAFDVAGYTGNPVVTSGNNKYLFSIMRYEVQSSKPRIFRINYFIPKNANFFAVINSYSGYTDRFYISFYQKDNSSSGYSACSVIDICDWYDADTLQYVSTNGSVHSNENSYLWISSKWISSLPFPVVISQSCISDYLSGNTSVLLKDDTALMMSGVSSVFSVKRKLRDNVYKVKSVDKNVTLPSSAANGETILSALIGADVDDVRTVLKEKAKMTITYEELTLTIAHQYDGKKEKTTTLKVSPDDAVIQKKDVALYKKYGYDLSDVTYSCTFPLSLTKSQTITVNYASREYPYTVNYYYDGVLGKSVKSSVRSYADTVSSVDPAEKYGYRLAGTPYQPALPATISEKDNVINVYYESWVYPYTVNYYYDGVLGKSVKSSVRSYADTVSSVNPAEKYGYRLADIPYQPALPATISEKDNVINVYYESWVYPYTVNYYYDGVLGKSVKSSVRSYADTVSSVDPAEKYGYRLAGTPYQPALPATISEKDNVISVYYESWKYSYTVNHYYGSKLQKSFQYSVPSYGNTVFQVPLIESDIYKLSSSAPYEPELPAVIDEKNNVINVQYLSPTSEIVSDSFSGFSGDIKKFVLSMIPLALGIVVLLLISYFSLKFFKKITAKS